MDKVDFSLRCIREPLRQRVSCRLADLLIPKQKHHRQIVPKVDQSAWRQLELKLGVENFDDLRKGGTDVIMQKRGQRNGAIADLCVWHGVRYDRLDDFAAI